MKIFKKLKLINKDYDFCESKIASMEEGDISLYLNHIIAISSKGTNMVTAFVKKLKAAKKSLHSVSGTVKEKYLAFATLSKNVSDKVEYCLTFENDFQFFKNDILKRATCDEKYNIFKTCLSETKTKKMVADRMLFIEAIAKENAGILIFCKLTADEQLKVLEFVAKNGTPEECLLALSQFKNMSLNKQKQLTLKACDIQFNSDILKNCISKIEQNKNLKSDLLEKLKERYQTILEENNATSKLENPFSPFEDDADVLDDCLDFFSFENDETPAKEKAPGQCQEKQ
ncbi:MAG: hypothetical protein RR400_03885 [Clostridia bacterium]